MLARSLTRSALARSTSSVAPRSTAAAATVLARSIQSSALPKASFASKNISFGVRSFSTTMAARSSPVPDADNTKPAVDKVVQDIADYVHDYEITSPLAVGSPVVWPKCAAGARADVRVVGNRPSLLD